SSSCAILRLRSFVTEVITLAFFRFDAADDAREPQLEGATGGGMLLSSVFVCSFEARFLFVADLLASFCAPSAVVRCAMSAPLTV
ncbi:hypothetical protein PFISCL1PPCAC_3918, partial [Pristionchus fissidentatus]